MEKTSSEQRSFDQGHWQMTGERNMAKPVYSMTVDLNVLDHLGINLYSNIAAVLTEAVANAWDADARHVRIDLDKGHGVITIEDDGHGMSIEDVNDKYLHIGYRRRTGGTDTTPKGRPVMGRKGLGKLSLFSIADIIEVRSAKGKKAHGLRMVVSDIRKAVSANKMSYAPVVLPPNEVNITRGTSIVLKTSPVRKCSTRFPCCGPSWPAGFRSSARRTSSKSP